jgi:two-component sensor histidine kinase
LKQNPVIHLPRLSALIVFFLAHILVAKGQNPAVYNINKYNGLSTNHVYSTLVDKHGYLWLGTTDGVYKYNGYTLQRYDYNDGLTNTDVWDMYEDREGRIWLMSIARGIGYIKNNVFHPAFIKNDSVSEKIYPVSFVQSDSVILFGLKNTIENEGIYGLIHADTVELRKYKLNFFENQIYLTPDDAIIVNDTTIKYFKLENLINNNQIDKPYRIEKPSIRFNSDLLEYKIIRASGNIAYFSNPKLNHVLFYDLQKNVYQKKFFNSNEDEIVTHVHIYKDKFYVLTNYKAYAINKSLTDVDTFLYSSLLNTSKKKNNHTIFFMPDQFWGNCTSTTENGLYINHNTPNAFQPLALQINNYSFISSKNDTTAYWWNDNENILCEIINGTIKASYTVNGKMSVKHIAPYKNEKFLLTTTSKILWLKNNGTLSDFTHEIDTLIFNGQKFRIDDRLSYILSSVHRGMVVDSSSFLLLGSSFLGVVHINIDYQSRSIYLKTIEKERFHDMVYYPKLDCYIIYESDKILLYNVSTGEKVTISAKLLQQINIQSIDKIVVDDYGNLIIKDYDKLIIFNPLTGKLSYLFNNYNFRNSFISANGNNLSLAGIFGIIVCNTTNDATVKNIRTYPNTKTLHYRYIYDAQFSRDNIMLKTDKGAFNINTNDTLQFSTEDTYCVIINNDGQLYNIHRSDTLIINQSTGILETDIIKPTGTGNLNIVYSVNGSSYNNTGPQIILPSLKPGSYNIVSLIASDDSWRSKPMIFTIYVQPYWWQMTTSRRIIFVLLLLAFIGFIYMVIVITRRIVNRNNERRNQRRELELKSIYSQINPHFIFNSLSTAQYFVKKNKNKEAFEHINQFSDLLRAYIKSSRAKYITIAEEIDNLGNYLQLQLTRFEEKFDYNITIDTSVNPEKVKIPSLLLQPLVENALNHGIFHSETKGNLRISFKVDEQDKDTLVCIVDDNGVGRQRSKELRSKIIRKADSYGTILIKELIDTFNKYEKINIEIEYVDKRPPQSGTTVTVRIKNYAQIP